MTIVCSFFFLTLYMFLVHFKLALELLCNHFNGVGFGVVGVDLKMPKVSKCSRTNS